MLRGGRRYIAARNFIRAIAAGCANVLKPASATPLSALALAAIALEAGLPEGALQIVPCDPPAATPEPTQDPDPLRRALKLLEARHRERIRLGLEPE